MPEKGNRRKSEPRHIRLYHSITETAAWRDLSGNAIKVLIELVRANNGDNNGALFLSVRDAATLLGLSPNTAGKAFHELADHGFIAVTQKGSFSQKVRHATCYRLTWLPAPKATKRAPTHEYKNWQK